MPDYEEAFAHYAIMDFERVCTELGVGVVFSMLSSDTQQDIVNLVIGGMKDDSQ